jgi:hypothetical protein
VVEARRSEQGNRSWTDNRARRGDGHRGDSWRDNNGRNNSWGDNNHRNDSWRDNNRHAYNDRNDHRRWDNRWRNDRRYDWHGYRNSHRDIYRIGFYSSPYRNYSYRRLSIGFFLDSLFYSNRYWIDDPWQYRLPEVYGPYRWVRYYDDALLVDIYTGEVVDVIHGIFW